VRWKGPIVLYISLYKSREGLDSWLEEPFLLFLHVKTLKFRFEVQCRSYLFQEFEIHHSVMFGL
jgi:hypothetical protein